MTKAVVPAAFAAVEPSTGRRALLLSCASLAIATAALFPQQARAQAFQGTPTTTAGNVGYDRATPGVETITVNTNTATINWTPTGALNGAGRYDFLPAGNTATYQGGADAGNYTVLNRIVPDGTAAIEFNGSVFSKLAGGATGGNVWFYSPGGIVVGASAIFNVGGLLLTTNDVTSFGNTANGFNATFAGGLNSTSKVQIVKGAQLNALQQNSYIALVAPRIEQDGTVQVNGAAAYAAGEQLTMTMNQGLFDIQVTVGTTDANGIVHTGVTAGPASTGAGDNHRIYMVAVPKNQALEMLLGGNVGFDATTAGEANGEIILGAGVNILEANGTLTVGSPAGLDADLTIGPGMYGSNVQGYARGDITAYGDQGSLAFSGDLTLKSLNAAQSGNILVGAQTTNNLTVNGDLLLQTNNSVFTSFVDLRADGGTVLIGGNVQMFGGQATDGTAAAANIFAGGEGSLTINGTTYVSTLVGAAGINPDQQSTDNFAGNITITSQGGATINFNDNVTLYASANGQDSNGNGDGTAGDGHGGDILVSANGGWINIDGDFYANADGYGGNMQTGGLAGGTGFGGSIDLNSWNTDLSITGNVFLTAIGTGGSYTGTGSPGTAWGGTGWGGDVEISARGPGTVSIGGDATLRADGSGGHGQTGGNGFGGEASVWSIDGSVALGPNTDVSAKGTGGNANVGFGGNGGDGYGGYAFINALAVPPGVEQFVTSGSITGGNATIDASGTGGNGGAGFTDGIEVFIAPGAGGDGYGGSQGRETGGAEAIAYADGASLDFDNTTLIAEGQGGNGGAGMGAQTGGAGGAGYGGTVRAGIVDPNGTLEANGSASYGDLTMRGRGVGGTGGTSATGTGGRGGDGEGGEVIIVMPDSIEIESFNVVDAGNVTMNANGRGGIGGAGFIGGAGGDGYGGTTTIDIVTGQLSAGDIDARAIGLGGIGGTGSQLENGSGGGGGTGYGGSSELTIGGTMEVASYIGWARAFGGDGGAGATAGFGGDAYAGGSDQADWGGATINVQSGAVVDVTGTFAVNATAFGGNGSNGGWATGGNSRMTIDGTVNAGDVQVTAQGFGGAGSSAYGGSGEGGTSRLLVAGTLDTGTGFMGNGGYGGNGAQGGGSGYGGDTTVSIAGGSMTIGTDFVITADASGGQAPDGWGGYANGGDVLVESFGGGSLTGGDLTVSTQATGGDGAFAGSGYGGDISLLSDSSESGLLTTISLGNVTLTSSGFHGAGAGIEGPPWGQAGTIAVTATGGSISANYLSATANSSSQGGFILFSSGLGFDSQLGSLQFGELDANANSSNTAGTINVLAEGGSTADLGDAELTALGEIGTGFIQLYANGGDINGTDITLTTSGDVQLIMEAGGNIAVTGTIEVDAGDHVALDDNGGGSIQAVTLDVNAYSISQAADLDLSNLFFVTIADLTVGDLTVDNDMSLETQGNLVTGDLTAGGEMDLDAFGDISFGNVSADDFDFEAGGAVNGGDIVATTHVGGEATGAIVLGDITVGPNIPVDDFSVGIASETSITVGNVSGAGHVGFATYGDLVTGNLTSSDLVMLLVGGDITTGSITTGADGRVYMADASMFITGGGGGEGDFDEDIVLALPPVATGGSITINGAVTTGIMQAAAGDDLSLNDVTAGGWVDLSAGGTANFFGTVSAPEITVTSRDINVASEAQLGVWGITDLITFNAVSDGPIYLGGVEGETVEGEYHFAEEGDISADTVIFNAVADVESPPPDIIVRDAQIEGTDTGDPGVSHVIVNTAGSVIVEGQVNFINAGLDDSLTINAGETIQVITDNGGISITDSNEDLSGTLELNAHDIWVADQSVIDQLNEDPNFKGLAEALATNNGPVNMEGYVRAGAIDVTMLGSSFYVQNSGTADDFAGITVGDGGLTITNSGEVPANVNIYGLQANSNGTFVTNEDFANLVGESGITGSIAAGSMINGCEIGVVCGSTTPPPPPPPPPSPEVPDLGGPESILGPIDLMNSPNDLASNENSDDGTGSQAGGSDGSEDGQGSDGSCHTESPRDGQVAICTGPLTVDELIEEPVTSGGDNVISDGRSEPN